MREDARVGLVAIGMACGLMAFECAFTALVLAACVVQYILLPVLLPVALFLPPVVGGRLT